MMRNERQWFIRISLASIRMSLNSILSLRMMKAINHVSILPRFFTHFNTKIANQQMTVTLSVSAEDFIFDFVSAESLSIHPVYYGHTLWLHSSETKDSDNEKFVSFFFNFSTALRSRRMKHSTSMPLSFTESNLFSKGHSTFADMTVARTLGCESSKITKFILSQIDEISFIRFKNWIRF